MGRLAERARLPRSCMAPFESRVAIPTQLILTTCGTGCFEAPPLLKITRLIGGVGTTLGAPGSSPALISAGDTRIVRIGVRAVALVTLRRLSHCSSKHIRKTVVAV